MLAPFLAAAALVVPASQAQQRFSVRSFASGLDPLTAIASTPAEPRRLYAVEQAGRIRYFVNGRLRGTFLDLRDRVLSGGEQGLLSVAFHPKYARNHRFYVDYTDKNGNTRVVEFRSRNGRGVRSTARQLLFVRQPYANHNGGELQFDDNGLLYVGMGDGGSAGDPGNRAQNPAQRLGKLLRIDPRQSGTAPYTVPGDNPGFPAGEIWAYGLRNPWRFSFDRQTGDLWIGDVGQSAWEEIDRQRAGSPGGVDYGWNVMEGDHPYAGGSTQGLEPPVYEYPHSQGRCVVTGGYVYRGSEIPGLAGWYVFGDFCTGRLEAIRLLGGTVQHQYLGPTVPNLSSFGEDASGELYAMSLSGGVYRLVP
jgi:glucose/arabinose dehydrogenase